MKEVEEVKLELYPAMQKKWGEKLHPQLTSILFSQSKEATTIELNLKQNDGSLVCHATKLDFITGDDFEELLFDPGNDVVDNAKEFVELDGYSLINCFSDLFHQEAEKEIAEEHERGKNKAD